MSLILLHLIRVFEYGKLLFEGLELEGIGPIDKGREHGTLPAPCVANREDDVSVVHKLKLSECMPQGAHDGRERHVHAQELLFCW